MIDESDGLEQIFLARSDARGDPIEEGVEVVVGDEQDAPILARGVALLDEALDLEPYRRLTRALLAADDRGGRAIEVAHDFVEIGVKRRGFGEQKHGVLASLFRAEGVF